MAELKRAAGSDHGATRKRNFKRFMAEAGRGGVKYARMQILTVDQILTAARRKDVVGRRKLTARAAAGRSGR